MATTGAVGLMLRGRFESFHLLTILLVFFGGGFFGWFLTELAAYLVRSHMRRRTLLIGTAALGLAAATVCTTAALFALQYRSFYSQWHAEPFGRIWLLQFLFTSASAFYQFAVMGLRLYLPLGPFFLVAGTWIMLRRAR